MRRETELPVRNESRDKHDGAPSATLSAGECVPVCITDTVADSSIVQSVTIFSGAPIVFKQSGSKDAVRTLNLKQKNHFGPSQRENSTARRLPKGRLDGGETSFRALGLNSWINGTLSTLRLVHPTPVQRSCIPAILQGRDVIGTSQTGSGKTHTMFGTGEDIGIIPRAMQQILQAVAQQQVLRIRVWRLAFGFGGYSGYGGYGWLPGYEPRKAKE